MVIKWVARCNKPSESFIYKVLMEASHEFIELLRGFFYSLEK